MTYQDVTILARKDQFYIIRAPVDVAEEIAHLQATGAATFSLALRPLEDQRQVDATALGETTSKIIQKYGLPIPQAIVPGFRPAPTATPAPSESRAPIRPRAATRPPAPARPTSAAPRPPHPPPHPPPPPSPDGGAPAQPGTSACRPPVPSDHARPVESGRSDPYAPNRCRTPCPARGVTGSQPETRPCSPGPDIPPPGSRAGSSTDAVGRAARPWSRSRWSCP